MSERQTKLGTHCHRNIWYFATIEEADKAAEALPEYFHPHYKLRPYTLGEPEFYWAVQLHNSGDYLGPDTDAETHQCPWCP